MVVVKIKKFYGEHWAEEEEMYIDGYVKNNLDVVMKGVHKDRDAIIVVDGYEGSGKSVFAMQIAKYTDPEFCMENICFDAETFVKKVMSAKKFQSIIYDEARGGLNARRAMSSINVALGNMLAKIRQRNLYIILVLPSFYDLDRNIALWRSIGLFHVYEMYDKEVSSLKRGFVKFFNRDKKKGLYVMQKKYYSYGGKPNFKGRFANYYPIDEAKYRAIKASTLLADEKDILAPRKTPTTIEHELRLKIAERMVQEGMSNIAIGKLLGQVPNTISKYKTNIKRRNEKRNLNTPPDVPSHIFNNFSNEGKSPESIKERP